MDAVTYPALNVVNYIQQNMIPVRIQSNNEAMGIKYAIRWTPTLIVLDKDGTEHYRTVGYLPPGALVSSLMLAMGKINLDKGKYEAAISDFDKLISASSKDDFSAEAIYFRGVANYKLTNDIKYLKEAYDKLSEEYPESEWTQRALPYRDLEQSI